MNDIIKKSSIYVALGSAWLGLAAAAKAEGEKVTYDDHVKPILREHCFTCHNSTNAKSDLAVDTYAGIIKGGASGEVLSAGDPDSSRLFLLVSHQEEPKMPPMQDKLAQAKLDVIKAWIAGGLLENGGSAAKKSNKPKVNLGMSGGAARPEGPAILPVGLSQQPFVYTAKTRALTALAASPWAPVIAIAGHKQVILYNSDSGQLFGILPFPEGVPHVLRFSRSGSLLLVGGGRGGQSGKTVVFDVKTGARMFEVGDELDLVLAADISEDHSKIALGGPQRVVRVYNTVDGSLAGEIRKHNEWITAVEFSPDGVLLATGDRNGDLFVWEADTLREYQALKGHTAAISAVSWRLDSNILASASEDASVRLWEMENGQQVKTWNAHAGGCASVAFAADGRLVTAGRDRQVRTWDQNGAQQAAFEAFGDLALRAVFAHDGQRVIGGDWAGQVRVWNTADQKQQFTLAMNPPTLEMVAQESAAAALKAKTEAETAAAELAEADKQLASADAGLKSVADSLAKAQEALAKATAALAQAQADQQKTAADQAAASKRKAAAIEALAARRAAAETAAARAAAAKAAADAVANTQTARAGN